MDRSRPFEAAAWMFAAVLGLSLVAIAVTPGGDYNADVPAATPEQQAEGMYDLQADDSDGPGEDAKDFLAAQHLRERAAELGAMTRAPIGIRL